MYSVWFTGQEFDHLNKDSVNLYTDDVSSNFNYKTPSLKDTKFVSFAESVFNGRRLGNLMFNLAALFYVAEHSNRTAVLPVRIPIRWLDEYFEDSTLMRLPNEFLYERNRHPILKERFGPVVYDPMFRNPHFEPRLEKALALLIDGYFQSFNYTIGHENKLKREFTFKDQTKEAVEKFIDVHKSDCSSKLPIKTVGVHVRRGDFLKNAAVDYGFTVVNEDYINYTVNYFHEFFNTNSQSFIIYFLCSDDIAWVNRTIVYLSLAQNLENTKFVFSIGHDAMFDMYLMSKNDGVIMSTGSFSWWSAWLANTTTLYYSKFPRTNSQFRRNFDPKLYYNPEWIGYP
ncbi:hypothetical protein HELRODRAFT_174656 [Helobdella robusta]|uniref:L-Fucosyltransferase n=1 Tax=Helobdella robusta TaxID=6412 RepID=T1F8C8_HELRO|nr:hypothetical protein HELRODRAFT_174656 [Helobdella robusta]ESO01690.1 hypothetical protein HELRODRAFT_174656 [Helobdella robusta]